jgi:hypothetical protein
MRFGDCRGNNQEASGNRRPLTSRSRFCETGIDSIKSRPLDVRFVGCKWSLFSDQLSRRFRLRYWMLPAIKNKPCVHDRLLSTSRTDRDVFSSSV